MTLYNRDMEWLLCNYQFTIINSQLGLSHTANINNSLSLGEGWGEAFGRGSGRGLLFITPLTYAL